MNIRSIISFIIIVVCIYSYFNISKIPDNLLILIVVFIFVLYFLPIFYKDIRALKINRGNLAKITPDIKDKMIEEWNEIAKKYGNIPSKEREIAWVEFSAKIEKEYGLTAWQVWEMVREKK